VWSSNQFISKAATALVRKKKLFPKKLAYTVQHISARFLTFKAESQPSSYERADSGKTKHFS
jgi:hypothetical protein